MIGYVAEKKRHLVYRAYAYRRAVKIGTKETVMTTMVAAILAVLVFYDLFIVGHTLALVLPPFLLQHRQSSAFAQIQNGHSERGPTSTAIIPLHRYQICHHACMSTIADNTCQHV